MAVRWDHARRRSRLRVLFTFAGGSGHAEPLVPIASAVRAAGHSVAVAGRHASVAPLEAHGFTLFPEAPDPPAGPATITPLLEVDMDREYRDLRSAYAGRFARAAATRLLELHAQWRPDILVCDEVDFGSMIAAERVGLPHATVLVTAAGSFVRPEIVAEPLDALRAEHGLPPDPDLAILARDLVLSPFPPSFRDPAYPLPPNTVSIRSGAVDPTPAGDATPWPSNRSDWKTVYFTLGTVFNEESGDLFARVIAGLRELPINIVVTVGRDLDTDVVGRQPENIHVERYIPQSAVLPHCDLMINHGGSGSVTGALAHGVPMVVLPMGADQPLNAARCEQLGVGIVLDAVVTTSDAVAEAGTAALDDPAYRVAAERIRDEIAGLPGPEAAIPLLARLHHRREDDR
jgi:UDP:flavonoid glycosyltransferase YjiC (YdhE family)